MNDDLKKRYHQLKENDLTIKDKSVEFTVKAFDEFYSDVGDVRNICFVWLDGRRMFMNYNYLVAGEYIPDDTTITLSFTTHIFMLTGVNLEILFYDIMSHVAKQITCIDKQYNLKEETEKFSVNEITYKKTF